MEQQMQMKNKTYGLGLIGAIVSVLGASLCCLGPFVLISIGVSGAWMSNLSAFSPYRPYFIGIAVAFLAYAFYATYRRPQPEQCEPGSYCAKPNSAKYTKITLWIITVLSAGLLILPSVLPYLYGN